MGSLFPCETCGRAYRYKTHLHRHRRYECQQPPRFLCPHCSYRAKRKEHLQTHMINKHSKKKDIMDAPEPGDICRDRIFQRFFICRDILSTKIESKQEETVISTAGRKTSWSICRDILSTNIARGFACDRCGRTYTLRCNMLRHCRLECGQEPKFACGLCPYKAKRKEHLLAHTAFKHHTLGNT
ncbi:zinc finger protein 775-like [Macrosteles quadrilineatus]|uniref:zinc finger protein 775-like n=1 Tax=Macrosteles quadrilineatus TaxID=74068 RepID=UPI0023E27251|nr:zinc finger protein 775-like [Macrosteles quadrilineatus]